jgi:hypothetical protein
MIKTNLRLKMAGTVCAGALLVLAWGCFQAARSTNTKYPYAPLMTEISPFAAAGSTPWIEFYNPLTDPVNASELKIVINDEFEYSFPKDLPPVPPKGFVLIELDGKEELEETYRIEGRTAYLHSPWNLTQRMKGKPGQIAVYRKTENKKFKLVGFVSWGAPGSKKSLTPERYRIWRSKWFVEIAQGSGDYNPEAIKKADYVIGLYPGSKTAGLTDWVIYFRDEASPGKQNVVPRPSMFSPHDGAEVRSEDIAIGWIPNRHARRFLFQITKDPGFTKQIETVYLKVPIYRPKEVLPEGTYYYRVKVFDVAERKSAFSHVKKIISKKMAKIPGGSSEPPPETILSSMDHLYQRKDTNLLCLDGCASDLLGSATLQWDNDHPPARPSSLVWLDPDHGLGNCARASIAMMVSAYGADLSQDRIAYYTQEESSGMGDGTPEEDLAHFVGMQYSSIDGGEETAALSWALGASPADFRNSSQSPSFSQLQTWLANNQPVMTRIPLVPVIGLGHVRVINGYRVDQFNIKWVRILDPLKWFPSPRWETFFGWNLFDDGTWAGPASASNARNDESTIGKDSDNDGIMDFDELNRFFTKPANKDSDGDGIEDKAEIRRYIFDSANHYDYGNPDDDADGVRKELDPDE